MTGRPSETMAPFAAANTAADAFAAVTGRPSVLILVLVLQQRCFLPYEYEDEDEDEYVYVCRDGVQVCIKAHQQREGVQRKCWSVPTQASICYKSRRLAAAQVRRPRAGERKNTRTKKR